MIPCEECRFWVRTEDDPVFGECRRYAPPPYFVPPNRLYPLRLVAWPLTEATDGCGQGESHPPPGSGEDGPVAQKESP